MSGLQSLWSAKTAFPNELWYANGNPCCVLVIPHSARDSKTTLEGKLRKFLFYFTCFKSATPRDLISNSFIWRYIVTVQYTLKNENDSVSTWSANDHSMAGKIQNGASTSIMSRFLSFSVFFSFHGVDLNKNLPKRKNYELMMKSKWIIITIWKRSTTIWKIKSTSIKVFS